MSQSVRDFPIRLRPMRSEYFAPLKIEMLSVIFRRGISRKINPKQTKIELSSFTEKYSEIKLRRKEKIKNVTKPFVPNARKDLFTVAQQKKRNKER